MCARQQITREHLCFLKRYLQVCSPVHATTYCLYLSPPEGASPSTPCKRDCRSFQERKKPVVTGRDPARQWTSWATCVLLGHYLPLLVSSLHQNNKKSSKSCPPRPLPRPASYCCTRCMTFDASTIATMTLAPRVCGFNNGLRTSRVRRPVPTTWRLHHQLPSATDD